MNKWDTYWGEECKGFHLHLRLGGSKNKQLSRALFPITPFLKLKKAVDGGLHMLQLHSKMYPHCHSWWSVPPAKRDPFNQMGLQDRVVVLKVCGVEGF